MYKKLLMGSSFYDIINNNLRKKSTTVPGERNLYAAANSDVRAGPVLETNLLLTAAELQQNLSEGLMKEPAETPASRVSDPKQLQPTDPLFLEDLTIISLHRL